MGASSLKCIEMSYISCFLLDLWYIYIDIHIHIYIYINLCIIDLFSNLCLYVSLYVEMSVQTSVKDARGGHYRIQPSHWWSNSRSTKLEPALFWRSVLLASQIVGQSGCSREASLWVEQASVNVEAYSPRWYMSRRGYTPSLSIPVSAYIYIYIYMYTYIFLYIYIYV